MTIEQATSLLHILLLNPDGSSPGSFKLRVKLEKFLLGKVPDVRPEGLTSGTKLEIEEMA